MAGAEELNAEELDEVILEACADQAIDRIIEAILVVDAKELNAEELDEAILEACADQADEAVELAGEAIEIRLEAKEFFELKAAANTRLCLGLDEFRRRIQGYVRRHS